MIGIAELAVLAWERGKGPLSFESQLQDGRICNQHMDHIRKRGARSDQSTELADIISP